MLMIDSKQWKTIFLSRNWKASLKKIIKSIDDYELPKINLIKCQLEGKLNIYDIRGVTNEKRIKEKFRRAIKNLILCNKIGQSNEFMLSEQKEINNSNEIIKTTVENDNEENDYSILDNYFQNLSEKVYEAVQLPTLHENNKLGDYLNHN